MSIDKVERRYTVTMDVDDLLKRLDAAAAMPRPYSHLHLQAAHTIRELMERRADRKAVIAELSAVLFAYEQWEAALVQCDQSWADGLPRFTQELYDRFIEIQAMRNRALTGGGT